MENRTSWFDPPREGSKRMVRARVAPSQPSPCGLFAHFSQPTQIDHSCVIHEVDEHGTLGANTLDFRLSTVMIQHIHRFGRSDDMSPALAKIQINSSFMTVDWSFSPVFAACLAFLVNPNTTLPEVPPSGMFSWNNDSRFFL